MFITLWECPTSLLNNICYCCVYTFHIFWITYFLRRMARENFFFFFFTFLVLSKCELASPKHLALPERVGKFRELTLAGGGARGGAR